MGRKGDGIDVRDAGIRIRFTWEGERQRQTLRINGKPLAPTVANIKYARRMVVEINQKIRDGIFSMAEYFPATGDAGALTVANQLDTWLDTQRIEQSTKNGYQAAINFWSAAIGVKALRAVLPSHILKARAARPDLTGKTLNNYTSVLREALQLAVTDGLLQSNPVDKVEAAAHQKEPPDPFTNEESERIMAEFNARHPGQVANLVEFWMWTGMRTSEIAGLTWDNVDLTSGTVLVKEAMVRGVRKNNTKTNLVRTVKLNSRAVGALQRQRQHTQMVGSEVFQDPRYDTPWSDERALRRSYWTPVLKLLGIRYRCPYNMRHTYATAMPMAGMNHSFCAKQLGHSVDQFQRTYTKWIDGEQNDREMDRLEMAIKNAIRPKLGPEIAKNLVST